MEHGEAEIGEIGETGTGERRCGVGKRGDVGLRERRDGGGREERRGPERETGRT